jgi:serine/threonine protein kinase/Flp pilus assembly protein TadD
VNVNSLRPGQSILHYRVLHKLGAGGMGEVYLAEDTKLDRKVAIKFLPESLVADEQARKRLVREAQAAAKLDHPNICSIHEVGEENGRSFIVMQYIEGETLDVKMKKRPLDLAESLSIAAQVADALSEAHAHGIIHRDIKPSNVIVTARGQAKVMDFGLARMTTGAIESEAETMSLLTTPGAILGTVPYMSPEQVRGEVVDARSDIFSFGVTLYEMLSGRQPFASESAAATASAILTKEPLPLARFAPDAPEELQRIARKCLEKDREQRYQSARELSIDLKNLQRDSDVRAFTAAAATSQRPALFRRFAFVALTLLSLAVIGAGVYWLLGRSKTVDSIAVLPFVNVNASSDTEYLSDGITDSLINSLSQLPKLKVIARSSVFSYKGKEVNPEAVGRELNVQALVTGRITQRGDNLSISVELMDTRDKSHIWGDQYNRKISDLLAVQEEISSNISENLRLKLTGEEQKRVTKRYTENTEAYQLYLKGRYFADQFTEEGFKKAVEHFDQAIQVDPNYALAYAGLAEAYWIASAQFLTPREAMPKAREAAVKALRIDEQLAEAHTSLASVQAFYDYDLPGSEKEFKRAIELNAGSASAHQWYGWYLAVLGRADESLKELKRAQELDPLSLTINAELGMPYFFTRQYDRAIEQFKRAAEMDPNGTFAREWLAWTYIAKGRYEEGIAASSKPESDDPYLLAAIGDAYARLGKRAEAQKIIERLKDPSKQRYVPAFFIAIIYIGLEEKEQALEWAEKSYQNRDDAMIWLNSSPLLDDLRSEPRFQDLVRRVGLPQ